jgi:hypothetical protein
MMSDLLEQRDETERLKTELIQTSLRLATAEKELRYLLNLGKICWVEIHTLRQDIGQLRTLLPDPRTLSGWDDDGCPADVAQHLIDLAVAKGIDVPEHLREANNES